MNELLKELGMTQQEGKKFASTLYNMANSNTEIVDEVLIDKSAELLDTFSVLTGIEF